jgi:hypothetical protein
LDASVYGSTTQKSDDYPAKTSKRIIESFGTTKTAPSPALLKLMGDEEDSPVLENQSKYMSKCAVLMFLSQ